MIKKTFQFALILLSVVMFVSCSKGVKALPLIGLNYSYNGFFVDGVRLINADSKAELKNKEIKIGETLYIAIDKVRGFKEEDGKIKPACKVTVTDPEGNVVLGSDDVYAGQDYEKGTNNFSVTVKMGAPIAAGKTYTTEVSLYDKLNPEYKVDITVKSDVIE